MYSILCFFTRYGIYMDLSIITSTVRIFLDFLEDFSILVIGFLHQESSLVRKKILYFYILHMINMKIRIINRTKCNITNRLVLRHRNLDK